MYVCLCNGYRDGDIRQVAQSGVRSARLAYMKLGAGPRCGTCLATAQDLIDRVHDSEPSGAASPLCLDGSTG